jgi:hypothetical protein
MSTGFKVSLSISKKSDGSQLYYKVDGERFKENKTIKLHVDTVYKVTLDVRPASMGIRLAFINLLSSFDHVLVCYHT